MTTPTPSPLRNLHIVLVHPTGPANVGLAARAVKAFGLGGLRIVGAIPGGPGEAAAWAAKASDVVAAAVVAPDLDAACPPRAWRVGTAAPRGELADAVEVRTPAAGAPAVLAAARSGPVALLFGPEATGLTTEALRGCGLVLTAPTTADYPSLNLGQAVSIVTYALAVAEVPAVPVERADPAEVARLEDALVALALRIGFTDPRQQRRAIYPLRRLLSRAGAGPRDVRLLLGLLAHTEGALDRAGARPTRA